MLKSKGFKIVYGKKYRDINAVDSMVFGKSNLLDFALNRLKALDCNN